MKQAADRAVLEAASEAAFEKGIEKGIEKGEKKKSLEIARAMLKKNLSVHQISELTGLTEKEILHD